MQMPSLKIGNLVFEIPVVGGPMGVQISSHPLPGTLANEGCLAFNTTIALGGPDVPREDFVHVSNKALIKEISLYRSLTNQPLAANFMGILSNVRELIETAVANGVRIISYGAGLPMGLPELVPDPNIYLIPIVSSARVAESILGRWWDKYQRAPGAVIIEGPEAGGHLGYTQAQLDDPEVFCLENLLAEVLVVVRRFEQKVGAKIPVIAAGGVYTGDDIARMLHLGASGVQMATRFVATYECPAADQFKQAYLAAKEGDIRIIVSPVKKMLGRAINNPFLEKVRARTVAMECPFSCIKFCQIKDAGFCIARALFNAKAGDVDNGLIFAGANVYRVNKIVSVKELIAELVEGIRASPLELPPAV